MRLGFGEGMFEMGLGIATLIVAGWCVYLLLSKSQKIEGKLQIEGDLMRENLNHIASALVGLSELLDDADEIIENASQIPTAGEMLMQVVQSMIMQKVTPLIQDAEIQPVIGELLTASAHGEAENENETT